MGHRALVLYERVVGRYDLHYSHWGADLDLGRLIGVETPRGGPLPGGGGDDVVEADSLATDVSFADVLSDHLDYLQHEAVYTVTPAYEVTEFRVLPFAVPTAGGLVEGTAEHGRGALVEVMPFDPGAGYVRGWFDGTRDVLGELVDCGVLAGDEVVPSLVDRLRRFAGLERGVIVDGDRCR